VVEKRQFRAVNEKAIRKGMELVRNQTFERLAGAGELH
jgi:hypothetical protein